MKVAGGGSSERTYAQVKDHRVEKNYGKVYEMNPKWDIDRKYIKYGEAVSEKKMRDKRERREVGDCNT